MKAAVGVSALRVHSLHVPVHAASASSAREAGLAQAEHQRTLLGKNDGVNVVKDSDTQRSSHNDKVYQ